MTSEERNDLKCICGGEVVVLQSPSVELVAAHTLTYCRRRYSEMTTILCQACTRVVIECSEGRAFIKWNEQAQACLTTTQIKAKGDEHA